MHLVKINNRQYYHASDLEAILFAMYWRVHFPSSICFLKAHGEAWRNLSDLNEQRMACTDPEECTRLDKLIEESNEAYCTIDDILESNK